MPEFEKVYRTWFEQKEYNFGLHEIDPQGCNIIEFYIDDWAALLGVRVNQQRTFAGWNVFKAPNEFGIVDQKFSLDVPPIGTTVIVKRTFTEKFKK